MMDWMRLGSLFLIALFASVWDWQVATAGSMVHRSHLVVGDVIDGAGAVPANGAIRFQAYILGRSSEAITEQGIAVDRYSRPANLSAAGYAAGKLFLNAGNFASSWQPGDTLLIAIDEPIRGESARIQLKLGTAGTDRFSVLLRATTLDVNGDGVSNADDGVMILRRLNKAGTVTTGILLPQGVGNVQVVGAIDKAGTGFDVDGDGDADANDGVMILRRLNGAGTVITGIVLPTGVGGGGVGGRRSNAEVAGGIDGLK